MKTTYTFQEEIQLDPINLPRAALRFSQEIAYPALDVGGSLAQLDALAERAKRSVHLDKPVTSQAHGLAHFLFQQQGFQGNVRNYNDPGNSYLNEVLDRRLGIPISLSVVFLAVAERIGLPAQGIGLPGHFIVSVQGPDGPLFLDPFHGGRQLSVIECARLVELSTGISGPFKPDWLRSSPPEDILARMLYNLRNIYIQQDKWRMALPVVERLRLLQPDNPDHLRDLGTIHNQNGARRQAIEFYERYLALAPEAADANLVRRNLEQTAYKLAKRN